MALWLIGSLGCERESLPDICPNVDAGQLVISEVRGSQGSGVTDSFGHYIEIYNAAGKTVDLQGFTVRLDFPGTDVEFFVRESIEVPAGTYFVIGPGTEEDHKNYIDYAIGYDITSDVIWGASSGIAEIEACDEIIDRMEFIDGTIPDMGSAACGNADNPPSADDNDEMGAGCWCVDAGEPDGPLLGLGLPGTPGGANRCP